MRVRLTWTWGGMPLKKHRTLEILTRRLFVCAWLSRFCTPYLLGGDGVYAFGGMWFCFSIFTFNGAKP